MWHLVAAFESHAGGRNSSNARKEKIFPHNTEIIKSSSFDSNKRAIVTRLGFHDGLSTIALNENENLRAGN